MMMTESPTALLWIATAAIAIASTATDVAVRRIPNILTLGGIALGVGIHFAIGLADSRSAAMHGVGRALVGVAVCSVLPVLSFIRREMGGGDVKLFAAIGALCGPVIGLDVEGFAFAIAIAVVLPWRLVRQGVVGVTTKNLITALRNAFRRSRGAARLPYAPVPKLRPVIMAPTILVGLAITMLRHHSAYFLPP